MDEASDLRKNILLIIPLFIGIVLMVYSWYVSYPLSSDYSGDFVFNHTSVLYWFSLPLILVSTYLIALTSKSGLLKWAMIVTLVMTMYSASYFYYLLPGSDSHYFRGLTEYYIKTGDLTPSTPGHNYFEWPSFFLLGKIATSLSGLGLMYFEFILYALIGFLIVTALYVYSSRANEKYGLLAVIAFFITMFNFLDYQTVPFSLAFEILLLLFMLETRSTESYGGTLTTLILFWGIVLTHAFVPVFFILYQLVKYVLGRTKKSIRLFLLTATSFFVFQISQAPLSFVASIRLLINESPEYAYKLAGTFAPASVPLDAIVQVFSRAVVIMTAIVCGVGFVLLLAKRKARLSDKSVFLSGIIYLGLGALVLLLGSRTLPVAFIAVSLGASYLFESKFRPYLVGLFLVLLILFVSIPIHLSFYSSQTMFQTREAYLAENFFIDRYNWTNPSLVFAQKRVVTYIQARQTNVGAKFEWDSSVFFLMLREYDSIVYTVGLGDSLVGYNYTSESVFQQEKLNMIYDNGFSHIELKSSNFTWARIR